MKRLVGIIDCTPSWQHVTRIYIEVLKNPDASLENKELAEQELLRLAYYADMKIQEGKEK